MAERRPIVLVNGELQELPSGDTLPGSGGAPAAPSGGIVLQESNLQIAHSSDVPSTGWATIGTHTPLTNAYNATTGRYEYSRNNSGGISGAVQPVFGTSWVRILKVQQLHSFNNFDFNGVCVSDSATNNHLTFGLFRHLSTFYSQIWLNNTFNSETDRLGGNYHPGRTQSFFFYKIERASDVLTFSVSTDGIEWTLIYTASVTTDLGGACDGVGIACNNTGNSLNRINVLGFDTAQQDPMVIGVKMMTQTEITATAYSTVSADFAGNVVRRMNNASAQTVTVEPNMTGGQPVTFIAAGAGAVSFVAGTGVTILSAGGNLTIAAQYGSASLIPDADTADTYYLVGHLTT